MDMFRRQRPEALSMSLLSLDYDSDKENKQPATYPFPYHYNDLNGELDEVDTPLHLPGDLPLPSTTQGPGFGIDAEPEFEEAVFDELIDLQGGEEHRINQTVNPNLGTVGPQRRDFVVEPTPRVLTYYDNRGGPTTPFVDPTIRRPTSLGVRGPVARFANLSPRQFPMRGNDSPIAGNNLRGLEPIGRGVPFTPFVSPVSAGTRFSGLTAGFMISNTGLPAIGGATTPFVSLSPRHPQTIGPFRPSATRTASLPDIPRAFGLLHQQLDKRPGIKDYEKHEEMVPVKPATKRNPISPKPPSPHHKNLEKNEGQRRLKIYQSESEGGYLRYKTPTVPGEDVGEEDVDDSNLPEGTWESRIQAIRDARAQGEFPPSTPTLRGNGRSGPRRASSYATPTYDDELGESPGAQSGSVTSLSNAQPSLSGSHRRGGGNAEYLASIASAARLDQSAASASHRHGGGNDFASTIAAAAELDQPEAHTSHRYGGGNADVLSSYATAAGLEQSEAFASHGHGGNDDFLATIAAADELDQPEAFPSRRNCDDNDDYLTFHAAAAGFDQPGAFGSYRQSGGYGDYLSNLMATDELEDYEAFPNRREYDDEDDEFLTYYNSPAVFSKPEAFAAYRQGGDNDNYMSTLAAADELDQPEVYATVHPVNTPPANSFATGTYADTIWPGEPFPGERRQPASPSQQAALSPMVQRALTYDTSRRPSVAAHNAIRDALRQSFGSVTPHDPAIGFASFAPPVLAPLAAAHTSPYGQAQPSQKQTSTSQLGGTIQVPSADPDENETYSDGDGEVQVPFADPENSYSNDGEIDPSFKSGDEGQEEDEFDPSFMSIDEEQQEDDDEFSPDPATQDPSSFIPAYAAYNRGTRMLVIKHLYSRIPDTAFDEPAHVTLKLAPSRAAHPAPSYIPEAIYTEVPYDSVENGITEGEKKKDGKRKYKKRNKGDSDASGDENFMPGRDADGKKNAKRLKLRKAAGELKSGIRSVMKKVVGGHGGRRGRKAK